MTEFVILLLVALNVAQFLNNLDLKARLNSNKADSCLFDGTPGPEDGTRRRVLPFHIGVTPEKLEEGFENNIHRRPPFPKLP